jgi:sugar-specific transcriptional regulator TrmB
MPAIEKSIECLIKLGLTVNQAKIYFGTLRTGTATAKDISKNANVGREDVYRILPALQEFGLIRKHLETPAKYEAVVPDEAVKILLSRKEETNKELQKKASEFLIMCNDGIGTNCEKEHTLFVVSRDNKSGVDDGLIRLMRKTNQTLDFTTRQQLFSEAFNEPGLSEWINEMHNAIQRGVKFRMILDKPENAKPFSQMTFSVTNSKRLLTHPNFQARYVSAAPKCIMIIFDDQASCIETSCQQKTKMSPYMITNNPVFATLNKAYFELLWDQGAEINGKSTENVHLTSSSKHKPQKIEKLKRVRKISSFEEHKRTIKPMPS